MDLSDIRGDIRFFTILGDPIAQSRASARINRILVERGLDGQFIMIPMHVDRTGLRPILDGLRQTRNFAGALVTAPHKAAALSCMDVLSDEARAAGAVNVLRRDGEGRLHGSLLDGEGFIEGLRIAGYSVLDANILLVGAGGAASAVAYALMRHGCARLHIVNRNFEHGRALVASLREHHPAASITFGEGDAREFDFGINATSLGMVPGDSIPLSDDLIRACAVVVDCVAAPAVTPLLVRANALGRPTHPGIAMFDGQLEKIISYWGLPGAN